MDDPDAPVTGSLPDDPRLPLITLPEAREAVRLLVLLADGQAGADDQREAHRLAGEIGFRLPVDG